jgi:hypothetical protein
MALYAALGGPVQHDLLARNLALPVHRRSALFALGFSGNPAQLPVLLEHLSSPDRVAAKIAAQAIAIITGLDLQDDAFVTKPSVLAPEVTQLPAAKDDPEAQRSLPPLEDDDLDADLVPAPEDGLPQPNAAAIRVFVEQRSSTLTAGRRYLGGELLRGGVALDWLERAPLRPRHMFALALGIQSRGSAWVETRASSREQRRRLAALKAGTPRLI